MRRLATTATRHCSIASGRAIARCRAPRWAAVVLVASAAAGSRRAGTRSMWENDLSKLTPVPADLLLAGSATALRELGTPIVRYLVVVSAKTRPGAADAARSARCLAATARRRGRDHRLRPCRALCADRGDAAAPPATPARDPRPCAQTLQAGARQARRSAPDVFEPFIADVENAATLAAADDRQLARHAAGAGLEMLLTERDGRCRQRS